MPLPTPDPGGVLLGTLLVTIILTPILSLLVLWRYRRAVQRSMHLTAPGGRPAIQSQWQPPIPTQWQSPIETQWPEVQGYAYPRPGGPSAPVVAVPAGHPSRASDDDSDGWMVVWKRLRSICCVYVAAGVAYGLVAATVWLQAGQMEFGMRRLAIVAVVSAWPVVPTVLTVLAAGRRTMALVWGSYVLLIFLLSVRSGIERNAILTLIVLMVVIPAVLLLALSGRNLRAVGPFLAVPVFIAAAGFWIWAWLALPLVRAGATVTLAAVAVTVALLVVAPSGLAYLWWTARRYARKQASDQMLLVSQWWFIVAGWESLLLLPAGGRWALAFWLAYVAFRLVIAIGLRLRKQTVGSQPLRLLLLRVFGEQRRSEGLLRRLGASCRHLGPVQMIAGPDLVTAALEPHEFLDSLRRRLSRQFVSGADDLQQRLAQLDLQPDPDGRYRVNELFCHDDTWRPTVLALVHRSDCILLDLRGFTVARQGATYEIGQLVELVPLRRVLVLTDNSTDHNFLRTVLDTAWRSCGPESPNWSDGGALRLLHVAPGADVDAEAVVDLLSASRPEATPGLPSTQGALRTE
jgi:hypothetical protein